MIDCNLKTKIMYEARNRILLCDGEPRATSEFILYHWLKYSKMGYCTSEDMASLQAYAASLVNQPRKF
jgi:hypothetical protein